MKLFLPYPAPGTKKDENNPKKPSPLHKLISTTLLDYHAADALPPSIQRSLTTLIHKAGPRNLLSNYRPISVCSLLYKILSRCLADALQTVLPWLISGGQVACQSGKSCFQNTRLIQDFIHQAY